MKRKIMSALLVTMSITAISCGCAFASDNTSAETNKTAVEDTAKPPVDENAVVGVVKSVSENSITIETMQGMPKGHGDKQPVDGEETDTRPERGEKPADGEEATTRPEREKSADGEEPPAKPDGEKPEPEEKTVLITSATLVYSKEDDTTNKTDLDSLKEGTMIRIELADGSSKDNSTVTAKTITVSERKEKPDDKIKDHKKLTDEDTVKTTA